MDLPPLVSRCRSGERGPRREPPVEEPPGTSEPPVGDPEPKRPLVEEPSR